MIRVVAMLTIGGLLSAGIPHAAYAADQLTIDQIVAHVPVTGNPPANFVWASDGSRYAYSVTGPIDGGPPVLFVHDMRTGTDRKLVSAQSSARGSRSREIAQIVWAPDATRIAFLSDGALEVADADGTHATTLAHDVDDPQWSPDGSRIAYVQNRDLYTIAPSNRHVTRLTRAENAMRTNGDPDWLYSEEMDVAHAYAWSPDGASIAYLSFDETRVTDFPIQQFLKLPDNVVEHQQYPLAGEANPAVSLRAAAADGSGSRTLYDGAPHDEYVLSFTWTPDSKSVVDEILDRAQQHLRLEAFARSGNAHRILLSESDARFVDVSPPPRFIDGGRSFLWISERSGVAALYRANASSGAVSRLSGTTPVAGIDQIDEASHRVYVGALYPSRREHALLAFSLDGPRAPVDLTPERGTHGIDMPEHGSSFIDTYSTLTTPPSIERRSTRSKAAATLFATPSLGRFALGTTTHFTIDSAYGKLDAAMIVPPDFDPAKRYPVVVNVYGGPLPVADGETSDDRWPGLFPHLLAQHEILSFYVDGPASRNDRTDNVRSFYHSMGQIAIAGPIAAADWLRRQSFVDAKRIGLYGWSYGGYLTAYTLTHAPELFGTGISGAPPTDWRLYDSAYTERYMGMPQTNRAAYDATAVLPAARALRAHLLIIQGTSDDNVHLANSIALLDAFVRAGKQVDYFVFPGARHGPRGTMSRRYLDAKMLDWWERTL